ncbi:unnamed protein product [Urochloa humidicola]
MPYAMVVYSSPRTNRGYLVLVLAATVIAVLMVSRSLSITPTPESFKNIKSITKKIKSSTKNERERERERERESSTGDSLRSSGVGRIRACPCLLAAPAFGPAVARCVWACRREREGGRKRRRVRWRSFERGPERASGSGGEIEMGRKGKR